MLFFVLAANMRAFFESYLAKGMLKLLVAVLFIASDPVSWGDQSSLVPVPPSNQEPDWLLGPGQADFGGFARMDVPDNYRFTGPRGARILLQRMRNPIPRDLVGILAPNSGKWWVILTYADIGYVKGLDQSYQFDASAILKTVREQLRFQNAERLRLGMIPIASVDWAITPVFDTNRYALEWAIRAETRTEKIVNLQAEVQKQGVVNHTIRLIGRRGVLDATAVQLDQGDNAIPLKELLSKVSFNPGERYVDFKNGDKIAKLRFDQLIVEDEGPKETSAYVIAGIWAGSILVGGGLMVGGVLLIRRSFRRQKMSRAFPEYEEHGYPFANLVTAPRDGSNHHNGTRRKRMFDYGKFYSDMMLEVSSGTQFVGPKANGESVPHAANGRLSPAPAAHPVNDTLVRANSDLIASQINLIEEQKRLLQEQAKLIEEKSRLIEEKNQLLEKQAELFERNVL